MRKQYCNCCPRHQLAPKPKPQRFGVVTNRQPGYTMHNVADHEEGVIIAFFGSHDRSIGTAQERAEQYARFMNSVYSEANGGAQ